MSLDWEGINRETRAQTGPRLRLGSITDIGRVNTPGVGACLFIRPDSQHVRVLRRHRPTLKRQWLYLNTIDRLQTVRRLVAFYVEAHNTEIPHSAFRGQTPDEMYYGRGKDVLAELEEAKSQARTVRLTANRILSCSTCWPGTDTCPGASWLLVSSIRPSACYAGQLCRPSSEPVLTRMHRVASTGV